MGKINLDPRAFYAIVAVVVVVTAFLVYRGADSSQKAPLPDPNMFKFGSAKTASTHDKP